MNGRPVYTRDMTLIFCLASPKACALRRRYTTTPTTATTTATSNTPQPTAIPMMAARLRPPPPPPSAAVVDDVHVFGDTEIVVESVVVVKSCDMHH